MRQREERIEAEPASERTEARLSADPVQRVLALQRTIGNQAVGALLAREPEALDTKTPGKSTALTVTLEGIGTIPLSSLQLEPPRSGHTGGADGGSNVTFSMSLTSPMGVHSAKLTMGVAAGQQFKTVVIERPPMRITLTDAMLTSYTTRGEPADRPEEAWTLEYKASAYAVK